MAILRTLDVSCDACPDCVSGVSGRNASAVEARRIARAQGWKRIQGRDLCPACAKWTETNTHRSADST